MKHLRSLLAWAGRLLSAVSLLVVVAFLVRERAWRMVDLRDPRLCAALMSSIVFYAAGVIALSYGWVRWLRLAGAHSFSTLAGVVIYCRSQVAKYIPGNMFHFVARQVYGNRLGAPHSALAFSLVSETASQIIIAFALAALGGGFPAEFTPVPRIAIVAGALLCLSAPVLLAKFGRLGAALPASPGQWFSMISTLLCYVPFFALNGLCLALLISLNHSVTLHEIPSLVGVWSVCWLAGYLVPGLPGGLGVREATLIYALSGWFGRPETVVVAMEMRVVSVLGDVALWLASLSLGEAIRAPAGKPVAAEAAEQVLPLR